MGSLKKTLTKKGYTKVPMKLIGTNHMVVSAKINGNKGRFILDTGASNSCVGFEGVATFGLETSTSDVKAAGAGATGMETQKSMANKLSLGKWSTKKCDLVIFDLSHVNEALVQHNAKTVDGIIGADILLKSKAVIDYKKKYVYLK